MFGVVPEDYLETTCNNETDIEFEFNEKRYASVVFGKRPVNAFLEKEGLRSIIRAHECKKRGYKEHRWNGADEFPPVITVFSAPNYCGDHDNLGAVFITDGDTYKIQKFEEHENKPYVLPTYPLMNAFEYFHGDLMGNLLDFLYQMCSVDKDEGPYSYDSANQSISVDQAYIDKIIEKSFLNKDQSVFSEETTRPISEE